MTNLQQLIEPRQGEVWDDKKKKHDGREIVVSYSKKEIDTINTQTATEAYRQALEDVLAGLYEVDVDKVPTIEQEAWANQYENKCEAFWYGESKGLSNVRAQIEGLLGKIE
jgi:hypothetical protein